MLKRPITNLFFGGIAAVMLLLTTGCQKNAAETHADHAGEAKDVHAAHAGETHNDHAGEAKDVHAGHEGEAPGAHKEEGSEIQVAPAMMKMAGITFAKATIGRIRTSIDLYGEVGFNEDRLVHITPRFPGILKEVNFRIGELVGAGNVLATIESNESMTDYKLKTPISGRIVEKHAIVGEHVTGQESLYMIADFSTVWVNFAVYPKDAGKIKAGQDVTITTIDSGNGTTGTINYITPIMDPQTRRITARVVLPNGNGAWRPGSFVNAHVEIDGGDEGLVVEKDAVQIVNNETVVFVQHEPNTFKPVDVSVGESDSRYIRILSGLEPGIEYVNNGAFELKAKIVTSSLGGHAGHGH